MNNWTVVEVLRHARHDWMNKLQLIKGNLALNKIDQVERLMDEMVMDARMETHLSNLKLPKFAEILLTFNWEKHPFHIEYEILDESSSWPVDDEKIARWIQDFFEIIENSIEPYYENHLSLSFELNDKNVRFYFDFSGTIKDIHKINKWLDDQKLLLKEVFVKEINEKKLIAEIIV
ncbi:sporulation initiation phosphotransferase B [Heyndrickxia camelliae]|uniref:Sporulation protein n=1 Tax=Heyndrickxia camelliae TaxID=1707093 RepID=A0A2N3LKZ5_9BACI|nr:sporulation initiation phosphotransferase B [Heyndrickxia camelliae]PKR85214.1 sporulation protein [Heyndrickxia camelliae]